MKNLRIYHNKEGWCIETPVGLDPRQLVGAIKFHKDVLRQRFKNKGADERERLTKLLAGLNAHTLHQVLINEYPWEKEKTLVLNNN